MMLRKDYAHRKTIMREEGWGRCFRYQQMSLLNYQCYYRDFQLKFLLLKAICL